MTRREVKVEAPALRLDPDHVVESVDWTEVFGSAGRVEVEIGIGKGRFLLASAVARPDVHLLGVEWANKYLRIAESRAMKRRLENVRFVRVDARRADAGDPDRLGLGLLRLLSRSAWPKKRHHKRRFLQPDMAEHLARTLIDGGLLHTATDHDEYWSTFRAGVRRARGLSSGYRASAATISHSPPISR